MYPALASFFADSGRTTARGSVYLAIQPPVLSHSQPKPLKLELICTRAHVRWATASEVRAWLIEHGYLLVHTRDRRGTPIVTLAWALGEERPEVKHG